MSQSEAMNRAAKARKLADVLEAHGADAEKAAGLPRFAWETAAKLAGVKAPSNETVGVVVALLTDRAAKAETESLFVVEDFDPDGISYVGRKWRTTEARAREFFAKHYQGSSRARLIGRSGLVLA